MKLKKSGIIIGIILLILAVAFIIAPNLIVTLINNGVEKDSASAYSFSFGDIESLGIIYGDTRELIEWEGEDIEEIEITDHDIVEGQSVPVTDVTQLYCWDYGMDFWTMDNPKFSIDILKTYGSIMRYGRGNPHTSKFWSETLSYRGHMAQEHLGDVTYPWLVKDGELDLLTDEYIDLAYVLTSPDIGQYNEEKQIAVWASRGQHAANDLYKEAEQYKEYYQATQVDRGSTDLPDLDIKGSVDEIKVMAHYDETGDSTIVLGPINLTYINKNNDDVAFGGISSMYFRGYNLEGEKIVNNIKIEKYIDASGAEHDLKYFTPEEDSFVDHNEQSYPDGTDSFYVVIKDPNEGKTSADEDFVSELALCISFKWMTINDALASTMAAYQYTVDWYNHSDRDYYYDCGGKYCSGHFDYRVCKRVSRLLEDELQEVLNYYGGVRELFGRTVIIRGFDITMDLGGSVWEDGVATKESIADGVNNTPDENGKKVDKPLSGIKVSLWAYDEDQWGDEGKFVTYTYTDENGDYIFEKISPLLKYYVTFEYNGQQYLPTDYLKAKDGTIYNSVQEMVDAEEYNGSEQWHTTSKGTETEDERREYNEKFLEIGSSPLNYVSNNSLESGELIEQNGQYYNEAFSQYELMGFVLNEDGNYSIDEDLALIDGFYTLEDGAIVEIDELQEGRISKMIKEYMTTYEEEEKERLIEELEDEFNEKIDDWNDLVDSYRNNPEVENLEGQRASGLAKLEQQKAERQEYIEKLIIVPDYDEMMEEIYTKIAGTDTTLWRKLQFIEDCKISSYTQNTSAEKDLYPVYDDFYINRVMDSSTNNGMDNTAKEYTTIEEKQNDTYDQTKIRNAGKTYKPIYEGQFFINQGLWRRQESDLALRKDIAYAATRINGKTEIYAYDKRAQMTDEETQELARLRAIYEQDRTNLANYQAYLDYAEQIEGKYYWEIQLRMRDYYNYFGSFDEQGNYIGYSREIYPADYTYRSSSTNNSGADLELYVTYKITVRNSSTSILSEITEVVDYYDRDYEYMEDLSWVMYKNDVSDDNSAISVSEEDYYNTMDQLSFQGDLQTNAKAINSYSESRYGSESEQSGMEAEYDSVYIRGLDSKKLASGEEAYIYLTFKVKSDNNGPVILDDDNSLKQNYVEINGYTTYYRDGTELPNNQTMTSNDAAGVIDIDSNPGNLTLTDIQEQGKYEKNFEDDTDRAKSIKVILDEEAIRSINGTVWEDERTQSVSDAIIGDGIRENGEIGIQGVTVELVEKLEDGNEYVWHTTTTDANGYYEFKTNESGNVYIVPGNYIIRFHYGDTNATALTNSNGGSNTVSYNGQDFKSTVYQQGLADYTEEYYNIQASDAFESNLSDAKDIWSRREEVNNYSTSNVTNHIAEVLASPYANTTDSALISELINNTNMTAETAIIVLEGEYNRTNTDGYNTASNGSDIYLNGNDINGNYTLNNVDFGLTERPKAQLELGKKVTNVRVVLANGNTLFDASDSVRDLAWTPKNSPYDLMDGMDDNKYDEYYGTNHRYAYRAEISQIISEIYNGLASNGNGLINITMDNELMHGATITISYELTVTNVGETDYTGQDFYYKGTGASQVVTTTANVVLDYVSNNLQFRADDNTSGGWRTVEDAVTSEELNTSLNKAVENFNTVIKTENLSSALTPGETTPPVSLVLTQLMTAQNTADDRTYTNIAEITTISNSAGRRMAFSVQGNQDPTAMPEEADSAKAERVVVLPPTGTGEIVVYITLSIVALGLITVGIIFIKKKVLKNN